MKSTLELIAEKEELEKRATALLQKAEKEERKLNEGENTDYNNLLKEIADKKDEIRKISEDNANSINTKTNKRTMEKFSLLKTINDIANNKQVDERASEVISAGVAEMRKSGQNYGGQIVLPMEYRTDGDQVAATVATYGQENVPEDKMGILEPLRASMVLVQAGATYMNGLVGDVSIPVYSGSQVGWKGEVDAAAKGNGTFSEVTLSPKRLTAYIDITKQFLAQDSNAAEAMLQRDIVNALSNKLEATILGSDAGSTTQPAGIFNGVTAETAAITYAGIVGMETTLESKNVSGDIKFIISPSAKADLKTTLKSSGVAGYLMEDDEMNGYEVLSTSNVAGKGVVMGNFNDYVIGQWGGIDLTVDPYTQAANGCIRLVINAYFDAKPRRADAFVKKVLKA